MRQTHTSAKKLSKKQRTKRARLAALGERVDG